METGLVIKSTGSRYSIIAENGTRIECTIKGKFRMKDIETTNPVAVGDRVKFIQDSGKGTGVITGIEERKNYIIRRASNLSKKYHIIAANIDHSFLMVTLRMPKTLAEFIDRFMATSEAYRIKSSLIFNKTDIYDRQAEDEMKYLVSVYTRIGYDCYCISAKTGENTEQVKNAMKGKISLLAGNSGVGKSSLLNLFNPALNLKTDEISPYHEQGKHVTTFPEMHPMPFGGYVIDTPGLRGFGVTDMEKNEIYHFFPEIFKKSKECRFNNCLHVNEPGCAVVQSVEKGEIDYVRYRSYLNILDDENRKYR